MAVPLQSDLRCVSRSNSNRSVRSSETAALLLAKAAKGQGMSGKAQPVARLDREQHRTLRWGAISASLLPLILDIRTWENTVILKYSLAWIPMVFIAILNGTLRELVLAKTLSELRAHQLSCLTGVLLFWGYTWLISFKWPLQSGKQAMSVGLVWLILTVAFEFIFGHFVMHHSWERLLQDYNILAGRLWVFVLLAVALLPFIVFKTRS